MGYLTYVWQKCFVSFIRVAFRLALGGTTPRPDEVLQIPRRDSTEGKIKVHVYRGKAPKPCPVLINFHGSGWTVPMHGSDEEFARCVVQGTDFTVLDATYRLAPEHPYPAAVHDAEDVVRWVLARPQEFDLSRVSISGFSAGGTLALVTSGEVFPKSTFRHLIAIYSPADFSRAPQTKKAPDPTGQPLPDWLATFFNNCYLPPGIDRKQPTVSPFFSRMENVPDEIVIITCAGDNLCGEAESVAQRLSDMPGKHVSLRRMEKCNHAWDKSTKPGSVQEQAKHAAYDLAIETLRR
ncbi:hypothetical protein A1O3_03709 [Capronia epimyces CBS 606.96]|uniref:Alpha/beta hydrolase fold-3 domain-containing protein n=1 Tax=Capronia epimyces CBS 606.96 TaxID=1182542 RepID=W9YAR8_9EURO|nr:uncharacterized protein A1O3_03709 [Capronia epimyces CBS 606.96]EXJ86755.1 hypothetical protein A1O3_03709 [Capronia epimyces CBS 606.96]